MSASLSTGAVLAGHRLEGVVGQGGMGVVYRATQLALDRTVALKVIQPALAADSAFRERFKSESRIAAGIDHPNVIPIYHAGEEDGVLFVTMRYVEGTDLGALMRTRGVLEPRLVAEIISATGAALDAAHEHGLVHRDVKPANILIAGRPDRPHVYLTDFGLTKRAASASGLTRTGQFVGTIDYVAPEQIQDTQVDGRADVYAMGCVLFETLTGRVPYQAEGDVAKLYAHLSTPPPVVSEHRPDAPAAFDEVVRRAMAKAPDERYRTAGELGRAALAAAGGSLASLVSERASERASSGRGPQAELAREPSQTALARTRPREQAGMPPTKGALPPTPAPPSAEPAPPSAEPAPTEQAASGLREAAPAVPAAPPRRRIGPLSVVVALALLAGAVAAAGFLLLRGGDAETTSIAVGSGPEDLAVGAGSVWVVNEGDRTVFRVNAETRPSAGKPITRLVGDEPLGVAVGDGSVWVTTVDRRLMRIDPASNRLARKAIRLPGAVAIAVGAGAVWVADGVRSLLRVELDPDGARTTAIPVGRSPSRVAVGEGAVWVIHSGGGSVSRIDPGSNRVTGAPIELAPGSSELAVGEGGVWVANPERRTLVRIDPGSSRVSAPLGLPTAPTDLAVGEGAVWLTSSDGRAMTRVDPRAPGGNTSTVRLAGAPDRVAVGEGAVWVTVPGADSITRLEPTAFGD
jgi:streptogramin lyase